MSRYKAILSLINDVILFKILDELFLMGFYMTFDIMDTRNVDL